MADILIRGMGVPKNCLYCHFVSYDNDHCVVMDKDIPICGTKPSWCPLVPLPEGHGRLGDLDALMNNIGDVPYKGAVRRVLMSAPTIIEADLEWKMKNCCCFSNTDQAEGGTDDGN